MESVNLLQTHPLQEGGETGWDQGVKGDPRDQTAFSYQLHHLQPCDGGKSDSSSFSIYMVHKGSSSLDKQTALTQGGPGQSLAPGHSTTLF